jgi:hypothetical protein
MKEDPIMSRTYEQLSEQQSNAPLDTNLPTTTQQHEPANSDDGWSDAAAESASNLIRGTFLKFADWKWRKGAEATEVPIGTQLIGIGTAAAWAYWHGGKPDRDRYIIRERGKQLPKRSELGELDESAWELGPDGKPRDPYVNTRFVYLLDPVSVEMLTYSTSSIGGIAAVTALGDQIVRMRNFSKSSALAVVELGAAEMKTKFGLKSKPVLKIVRWYRGGDGSDGSVPQVAAAQELRKPTLKEEMADEVSY